MSTGNFCVRNAYIDNMEFLTLLLLYILTQNPDFPQKIQPLCASLKNSEEIVRFLKDLSAFSDLFSKEKEKEKPPEPKREARPCPEEEKTKTNGIADGFIENFLKNYVKTGG